MTHATFNALAAVARLSLTDEDRFFTDWLTACEWKFGHTVGELVTEGESRNESALERLSCPDCLVLMDYAMEMRGRER